MYLISTPVLIDKCSICSHLFGSSELLPKLEKSSNITICSPRSKIGNLQYYSALASKSKCSGSLISTPVLIDLKCSHFLPFILIKLDAVSWQKSEKRRPT